MRDHHPQLVLGLWQCCTRTQPGEKRHVAFAPIILSVTGVEVKRDPELHFGRRKAEIRWHHSHYPPVNSVKGNRVSEDARITVESGLPESVAEDDDLVASWFVFSGEKRVSDFRSRPEQREQICGNRASDEACCLPAAGKIELQGGARAR